MTEMNDDFDSGEAAALWAELECLRERVEDLEDRVWAELPSVLDEADDEPKCPTAGERLAHALGHADAFARSDVTEQWIRKTAQVAGVLGAVDLVLEARDGGLTVHLNSGEALRVMDSPRAGLAVQVFDEEMWAALLELEELG